MIINNNNKHNFKHLEINKTLYLKDIFYFYTNKHNVENFKSYMLKSIGKYLNLNQIIHINLLNNHY